MKSDQRIKWEADQAAIHEMKKIENSLEFTNLKKSNRFKQKTIKPFKYNGYLSKAEIKKCEQRMNQTGSIYEIPQESDRTLDHQTVHHNVKGKKRLSI